MGVAIEVNGLTKSFGIARIWEDVSLTIPEGEVSVMLGPSGTGKSVFLKSLIGLLRAVLRTAGAEVTNSKEVVTSVFCGDGGWRGPDRPLWDLVA